jgi:SAM-dependent methyltransferase
MSAPASETATAYDAVIYPGNPVARTHPDRLRTVARLWGLQAAPASRCRVLELGCGIGGNLMAMACQWPESEFVGIDLSRRSIEIGNRNLAELGIKNLTLQAFDIMQVTEAFGRFDYIVAHGVYSWVPDAVRERLLAITKAQLAPNGVGYVSYNAYPGSHLRDISRDLMLYHTRDIAAPQEKIQQARALLALAAETVPADLVHGRILRDQLRRVEGTAEEVVYHDDLEANAQPFLLHEVAEAAARHGLQYLGDANFGYSQLFGLPDAAVKLVEQIPESRAMEREQYLDFVTGRMFRRTLLVHDDVVLERDVGPAKVRDFFIAGRLTPAEQGVDARAPGAVTFRAANGRTVRVEDALGKAALLRLGEAWPGALTFDDLLQQAQARLGERGVANTEAGDAAARLAELLFRAYAARQVDLHCEPPPLTTAVSERPEASLLARRQVEAGPIATNLRHSRIVLDDPVVRRFLPLIDGTRTLDALTADLNAALAQQGEAAPRGADGAPLQVTRAQVEENLAILARLALLVR